MKKSKGNTKQNYRGKMSLPQAKKLLPIDYHDLELEPIDIKFVAVYCTNGFDVREAYLMSGKYASNERLQKIRGNQMLGKPGVQEAVRRFINFVIGPYQERLEFQLLDIYYKRAFYTVSSFYDEDGHSLTIDEIQKNNPEHMIVIDGVERKTIGHGANQQTITSYQLASRDHALRVLYEMVKLAKGEGTGGVDLPSEKRKQLQKIFDQIDASLGKTGKKNWEKKIINMKDRKVSG
jgi:hypothetical protein